MLNTDELIINIKKKLFLITLLCISNLFLVGIGFFSLAGKSDTFVELGGSTVAITPSSLERSDEVVRKTALTGFISLMTWNRKSINIQSEGIHLPRTVYEASFLLDNNFKTAFLSKLAKLIGKNNTVYLPEHVSPVKKVDGKWEVTIIGYLLFTKENKLLQKIPYNKTIVLSPTLRPSYIERSPFTETIEDARQNGIKILEIKNYEVQ